MNISKVYSKYLKFADNKKISRRALRSKTLKWNKPFKIWGTTIEGDEYNGREVFTFNGPSRNPGVPYNYNALGYMIFFDMGKGDYRTFVYDLITKLEMNGVTYEITGGFDRTNR